MAGPGQSIIGALLEPDEIPQELDPREQLLSELDELSNEVVAIKQQTQVVKAKGNPITNIDVFNEMTDLSTRANEVLDAVRQEITSSSLVDPELIAAYASLLKSTREIISDYITIYRDHQNYQNKVELENIKQTHRREILKLKYDLDNTEFTSGQGSKQFIQEDVMEILNRKEKELAALESDDVFHEFENRPRN